MATPTGEDVRVLQVHPSLRCNLRCLHCYSSSGPEEGAGLPAALLRGAIADAAAEGYNVLNVSGGEPLLYPHLAELLDGAHGLGMVTTVATNGMLLDDRRLAVLAGRADLVAVSLDGVPESHDRMRGAPGAFERMAGRLGGLWAAGIPFGFIFTLTQSNAHELERVVRFAVEAGAVLLQVHPLEEVGRAEHLLAGLEPDDVEAAAAWLELQRLRSAYGDWIRIHTDLVDYEAVRASPACLLADGERNGSRALAELLSPLVVEADGTVVPLQYGFAREYALGRLGDAPLRELAAAWRRERYPGFAELCRRSFDLLGEAALPLANWYRLVARVAEAAPTA